MTTAAHCIFCDIVHGAAEVSVCYEDADAIAFMDIQPVNPGHTLVVPRRHVESLRDLPHELARHLDVATRITSVVEKVSGAEGINLVVSSGAAGRMSSTSTSTLFRARRATASTCRCRSPARRMPDRSHLDAMAARVISTFRDPARVKRPQPVTA